MLFAVATLLTTSAPQTHAATPAIITPPQSQTVGAGATVTFSVVASGDAPLTYEWWGEFGPLVPARTGASLTLTNADLVEAGSYKVIVRNASGAAVSTAASLTVNPAPANAGENFFWAHRLGGTGANPGANLAVDAAGHSYVVGSFTGSTTVGGTSLNSAGGSDVFVAKFNRAGALLWARSAGGAANDFGNGIAVDAFGNVHLAGSFSSNADFGSTSLTNAGGSDVFVACYDRNGALLWANRAGGPGNDTASRLAVDGSGNSYVAGSFAGSLDFAGSTLNSAGADDVLLAKFSSAGVPLWAKRFGGTSADAATSLAAGPDGTVFVAGRFRGSADFGGTTLSDGGGMELFLAKCNNAGTVQWAKKVSGADANAGAAVVVGEDGTSYLNGTFSGLTSFGSRSLTNREVTDRFVARYDAGGTVLFASCVGGLTGQGISLGIKSTDGGSVNGFATVADFASGGGTADLVLAKFTGPSTLSWARQAGGSFAEFSLGHALDDAGNQYFTGFFEDTLTGTEDPNYSLASIRVAKSSPPLPPLITIQPQGITTTIGSGASFGVTASSSAALSYQWRLNGTNLPGATSASYSIVSAQPGHAGNYQVLVSSVDGSALSSEAVLNLGVPPDLTAPTVVISSPAANTKFTNASITVSGTASDNGAVDRVEVQLNNGAFTSATGGTNWSASLTLVAGTNTIRVKSIDVAGNESAVVTRSLIYAPVSLLTLAINGNGSVSPNLNGQLLEIGSNHTMTATPSAGYSFTGWGGDVSSANATLNFTMLADLELQANFADITVPAIAISTPAANTKFTNATVTVTGTASDSAALNRVEVQVNNGSFQTAGGTANWSASVTLPTGTNTIRARSIDAAGNISALSSRSLIYAPVSPVTIAVNGFGSVTPNLNGQLLELGASYTVTAVPGTNTIFTSWSGGSSSTNAALTFTMSPALTLQANFATNPAPDLTAPNVAITSPAAGTKFNSASLIVSGTASDDVGVTRVEVQLNNGSYFTATGTNNWSASITLTAGTNTLRARATDTAGNISSTASRTVIYAPLAELTLLINGQGSVAPNLDGQLLEVGSNYTVTATPTAGFTFTGWSGGTSSTSATLVFNMQPGLELEAKFADLTAPGVAISTPAANTKFTNPSITVTGTASDSAALSRVEVQVNNGSFQTASGTAGWSASVTLPVGTNTIRARSIDASGNISSLASRSLIYAPVSPITITVNGFGSVTPNLNGQLLELGASYTVTAVPGTNTLFTSWSGGSASTNAALTFTMSPALSLQANFATNPPPDLSAPNVAITSPAAGAKFNAASLTVSGTASDDTGVTRVEVQLNNGSYVAATGTNNWSASITLAIGTNTLRARAIDTAGNTSSSASRTVIYAPLAELTLLVNGPGSVAPNLDGQSLEVGSNYTVTATSAVGFTFTGWSGGSSSTSATLNFIMLPGLELEANFADLTAPTVVFSSPAAGAKFTNASINLTGTAADSAALSRVEVQLNNGSYFTASGTTNWSGSLTLVAATNTVRVKSIDLAGNQSAVVTRSFLYAPVGPLALAINGNGSVSPNLNGQLLEIGGNHTVTATPATGFSFTGWSGGLSSTNTTLNFTMSSGLTLQASFADLTAPTVAIAAPAANTKFTNASITVTGTASDSAALSRVEVQLNNGSFQPASGTTSWSASVTLPAGTNTIRARSIDASGNISVLASRSLIHAPVSPVTIAVNGFGSVTPNLNGQLLELGASYSVTAVPGANTRFTSWSGGSSSTNAALTFTMSPALSLQANFATNPAPDLTAPNVAITSPAAGTKFNSASLTVSGTASDDAGVTRVEVQLNNGSYVTATGTNNWSASVTLATGTNTLRARAIDTAGNISSTASRPVIFAPLSALALVVNGEGSVAPNLNGQALETGSNYTVTATPGAGCTFTGWSGGSSSTNATLTFTMQPGLLLQANFNDLTPPTVGISTPAAYARFNDRAIVIQGTAADSAGVDSVEYQLNSGPWYTAIGTTSWSIPVNLAPGTNVIHVRSLDLSFNESPVATRTFIFAPVSGFTLLVAGAGSVAPNLNGQALEVGSGYTVTATPAAGYTFTGWSGGASGTNPVLNFTMQSNLVVQANFADINAPNIAFSSPANNAKFTNANVTFTGTATDSTGLARVEVQVNDGPFQVASGTASWSASLTLAPGANVVRARAIDLSDNVSALISRSVVFAPLAPLAITINGGGSVSPNLHGQLLEIGATYSMTATASSGYSFGGWSGGVSESSATLAFTMQAGLALQANFTDAGAPTVAFTAPANNAKFTNHTISITGTASDNVSVARVEYRINGGLFSVASGAANWSATLTLPPGTNIVQVKSIDGTGNESALVSRSFIHAPVAPLTLTVSGNGSVSPVVNGQFLELGATYNVTASPASGWRFTGWSGDASGTNATLAFVMQSGRRVQANFADAAAPSVAFAAPANNAKFTNAVITITGTASDNVALSRVEYQLGNGSFIVASGASNWSAGVTLAPGTNTLRVRAIDTAGNISATASRSFIFAPVSLFTVTVNGSGTVAPGLNGQLLEIGASYSITATPAPGFAFNGWSGDASGTNATLNFKMIPNMTVQANFSDATAPAVAITAPAAGAKFTSASVALTGTASDNVAVSRVDCSLNNGAFTTATGTTNWSASLTLAPGTNSIRVRSIDNLGNESALVTRTILYAPTAPLTLLITGSGSVTPNLHGQWLEVGAGHALTALPAPGFAFSGWTGGLTNSTASLSFVMQTGLVLRANFVDATPPSVSITSPAPDLKVFSAATTVLGTATDNVGVTRVEVQLNGGAFAAATGTTNWSAGLTLAPGTNRIRARSFDAAGNSMTSAERTMVHAPLALLTLGKNGHGMIMPDLNGQLLEVGSPYSVTAVPMPGNAFQGWTGSVVSTGATLNFTMQPGCTLTANFRDATAPDVAILSPAAGTKFTSPAITVAGVATDNTGVARVEVQLNGGGFNPASGTSDWEASLNLAPGTNVVIARSIDLDGNLSATTERRFIHAPTATILLAVNGSGAIVPNLNGQSLEIGATYVITAAAEAGHLFTAWSGSSISSNAALTFTMQPGLLFVANFAAGPTNDVPPTPTTNLLARVKGKFYGLFYEESGAQPHSAGSFTLNATAKGRFSATIELAGKKLSYSGQFSQEGFATNRVKRPGTNALQVILRANLAGGGDLIHGEIGNGEWTSQLVAEKNVFNAKSNPAPFAGRNTILIPGGADAGAGPTGDGYGTVVVEANGMVTVVATLADGTKISEKSGAGRSGYLPIHASLYGGKGGLISWLRFIERDSDDVTGLMNWFKPRVKKARLYPEGFALETTALGSSYTPPTTRTNRVLNFEKGFVELSGGNLPLSLVNDVQLTESNKVVNLGANALTLSITASSGLFKGTTMNPITKKTVTFRGALLQKGNYGAGVFTGTNQIGRVTFGP